MESTGRFGSHGPGREIGLQSFEERRGPASGPGERLEESVHQVDQSRLITAQHPEHKQVAGLYDVVLEVKSSGQQEGLASLLIGTRDPVRARIGAACRDLPSVVPRRMPQPAASKT